MWLIILYIIGGYIGKYILANEQQKTNLFYFVILILIYLSSSFFSLKIFFVLQRTKIKRIFIKYLSPTMIIQSISLVLFFSRLKFKYNIFIKFISFFTPLTFNVTLIHQRLLKENFLFKKKFLKLVKELHPKYLFFKIYGLAIIIYILCSIIDFFRLLLFKILKIRELSIFVERKISLIIDQIMHDN